jgi:hypothetical protein
MDKFELKSPSEIKIQLMKRLFKFLQRSYRLLLNLEKQQAIVWKELKKLHSKNEWRHGIYEKEKCVETIFEINEGHICTFYYFISDKSFHCRVKILQNYPIELTSDLFILSTHFNNLLNNGVVTINVDHQFVEYHQKRDLLIPVLYTGEIEMQLISHFHTSKDIFKAFQRLIVEQEAPAIIIADLMKEYNKEDEEK